MKKAVLISLIMAGSVLAQSVSDKVLFDRATALVKGLRTGTSWNKTVADLKKDFPDMKELEPFKVSEDATIQTQEFGALYNFDTAALREIISTQCSNFPKLKFSFYQNKLYRVEVYYYYVSSLSMNQLSSKVASSFFDEKDKIDGRNAGRGDICYYGVLRSSRLSFSTYKPDNTYGCINMYNEYGDMIPPIGKTDRLILTNTSIENQFYTTQKLLHPDWGYTNLKWNSTLQEVKSLYKDVIEVSDSDSAFGLREFIQKNNGGGGVSRRIFYLYQDSLFKVSVDYRSDSDKRNAFARLKVLYREDVPVEGFVYENPQKNNAYVRSLIYEVKQKQVNERKKHLINTSDF